MSFLVLLSTDHVTWISSQLNTMQQDTMVLSPNAVVNVANEMGRKRKLFNFGTLKRLALLVNVGKSGNGQTFIGGVTNSGNHWVLVVVELRPFKRIIYCDTLAWDPPPNILEVVNSFTNHIPRVGSYDSSSVCTAHSPLATSTRLGHVWSHCSDQCSACDIRQNSVSVPYIKDVIYLQRPGQHSYYLRRVLMCWFAESCIDINYVLLQPGWRVPPKSDHSFSLRQDTAVGQLQEQHSIIHPLKNVQFQLLPQPALLLIPTPMCLEQEFLEWFTMDARPFSVFKCKVVTFFKGLP